MALELKPLLDNAQSHNDGSMDTDDFKKINLYGLAIPAVLGEAFCSLRGKPMTEKEVNEFKGKVCTQVHTLPRVDVAQSCQ